MSIKQIHTFQTKQTEKKNAGREVQFSQYGASKDNWVSMTQTQSIQKAEKKKVKTWRCSADRVKHKWSNKKHYISFCQVSLQHQDIFKRWQMKVFKNSGCQETSCSPQHSLPYPPSSPTPPTQPSKVTVTTRVLTHHCDVCWTLLWKTLCHPDWQRTWPLWGAGQEDFTNQERQSTGLGGWGGDKERDIERGRVTERGRKQRGGARVT